MPFHVADSSFLIHRNVYAQSCPRNIYKREIRCRLFRNPLLFLITTVVLLVEFSKSVSSRHVNTPFISIFGLVNASDLLLYYSNDGALRLASEKHDM